jgi:hypothetical protein
MFNAIERFRTVGSQSFLDRGTVRRGGLGGSSILRFASEPEKYAVAYFGLEAKASAEVAGGKRIGAAGAARTRGLRI